MMIEPHESILAMRYDAETCNRTAYYWSRCMLGLRFVIIETDEPGVFLTPQPRVAFGVCRKPERFVTPHTQRCNERVTVKKG